MDLGHNNFNLPKGSKSLTQSFTMQEIAQFAKQTFRAGLCPHLDSEEQAIFITQFGVDCGLGPAESLNRGVYIVETQNQGKTLYQLELSVNSIGHIYARYACTIESEIITNKDKQFQGYNATLKDYLNRKIGQVSYTIKEAQNPPAEGVSWEDFCWAHMIRRLWKRHPPVRVQEFHSLNKQNNSLTKEAEILQHSLSTIAQTIEKASQTTEKVSQTTEKASQMTEKPAKTVEKASKATSKTAKATPKTAKATPKTAKATGKPAKTEEKASKETKTKQSQATKSTSKMKVQEKSEAQQKRTTQTEKQAVITKRREVTREQLIQAFEQELSRLGIQERLKSAMYFVLGLDEKKEVDDSLLRRGLKSLKTRITRKEQKASDDYCRELREAENKRRLKEIWGHFYKMKEELSPHIRCELWKAKEKRKDELSN